MTDAVPNLTTVPEPRGLKSPPAREPHTAWSALDAIDDLGVQYASVYGRINPARNYLRLMAAVLTDAIRVFSRHRSPRRRREELAWLTSADRKAVFAFENVCEALGIDADRLRLHVIAQSGVTLASPGQSVRVGPRSSEFGILRRAG